MASRAVAPKDFSKETEYFDVAPSVYLDNIINAVYDYTADVLDAVEGVLKEQEDLKGREKDIEKALNTILELYKNNIDENFDKFELYVLNNILRIPDHVTLPAKDVSRPNAREDAKVLADIDELRRKIAATQYITDSIKVQSDLLDKQLQDLRPFTEKLTSLANLSSSQRLEPHRAMQHAIDHAKELHALMHQVELETAKDSSDGGHTSERFSEEQFNQLQSFLGAKR